MILYQMRMVKVGEVGHLICLGMFPRLMTLKVLKLFGTSGWVLWEAFCLLERALEEDSGTLVT